MITLFSIRFLNTWEFFFLQTYKSIFWWNPGLVFVKKCRYLIPTNTTATAWWRRISRIFKISCCRPIILRKWLMWSWMLTGGHQSARTTSSRNRATAVRPQPDRRPAAASTGHQLAAKWRQRSLCACTIVHCCTFSAHKTRWHPTYIDTIIISITNKHTNSNCLHQIVASLYTVARESIFLNLCTNWTHDVFFLKGDIPQKFNLFSF